MRIQSVALGICLFALTVPSMDAATLIVTSTADSGAGSLRGAIAAANAGDTIQFDPALNGQTITLTSAQLLIDKNLTITGPGPGQLAVRRSTAGGTQMFRIFEIGAGNTVTIQGLTITNGIAQGSFPANSGGGIFNGNSMLTISNSVISGNSASFGAGVFSDDSAFMSATLTVNNSTVSANSASQAGGAIYNRGSTLVISNSTLSGNSAGFGGGILNDAVHTGGAQLTISNSTLSSNSAAGDGGGIYSNGSGAFDFASIELSDSTISGNSATRGGGIYNDGFDSGTAFLLIKNSTFSGNQASVSGGGIYNDGAFFSAFAWVALSNSTMSGNSAGTGGAILNDGSQGSAVLGLGNSTISDNSANEGGGIYSFGSSTNSVSLSNTILKTGTSGENIRNDLGLVDSFGYNLSNDNGGGFLTEVGDQINTNPLLGPLQDNGGPTFTHELLMGSPALDAGDPSFSPPPDFDQRGAGFPRVFNTRIDIGSFELQPVATKLLNISTRLRVLTDDNVLIGGFIVTGNTPKRVIVRAIGPSLTNFGIPGALADPVLELHGPGGFSTITNDNWRVTQESEIEATGLAPANNLESAIVAALPPGAYTAIVRGSNSGIGVGLVEGYDLDSAATAQLANISTRGFVETGDDVMIGGFILGSGSATARVLIRAIGPSLTTFGVPNALADPTLELHNNDGATIATNDDWRDNQEVEIEATGIPPIDDHESAILETIAPGTYTAIVRGKNGTVGVALVETYRLGDTPTAGVLGSKASSSFQ